MFVGSVSKPLLRQLYSIDFYINKDLLGAIGEKFDTEELNLSSLKYSGDSSGKNSTVTALDAAADSSKCSEVDSVQSSIRSNKLKLMKSLKDIRSLGARNTSAQPQPLTATKFGGLTSANADLTHRIMTTLTTQSSAELEPISSPSLLMTTKPSKKLDFKNLFKQFDQRPTTGTMVEVDRHAHVSK